MVQNQELRVLQVNLHKSKIASAELLLNLEKGGYDVALVQEPWIASGNVVAGLKSQNYTTYTPSVINKVRSAILVKKSLFSHIDFSLSTDDLTVVAVKGAKDESLLLASCYMPHDCEAPTAELQRLAATSSRRKQALVVGADANAHHTVWGSPDINQRGESLLNYILQSSLVVANRGEEPTYIGPTSRNVLDITLYTSRDALVENWRVLSTPSFSDHRYIYFSIRSEAKIRNEVRRNPRNTNWDLYRQILLGKRLRPCVYNSHEELEKGVTVFTNALNTALHYACPTLRLKHKTKPPWWNKELGSCRRKVRECFNWAKLAESEDCWNEYKDLLRDYKKLVRRTKRESWKNFCSGFEKTHEVARLRKLLSKSPASPGLIRKSSGEWTDNCQDSLEDLVSVHFPGCKDAVSPSYEGSSAVNVPEHIFTENKIEWAIRSFDPYKSPGTDGIIPAMLQNALCLSVPWLKAIFRGCLKFSYVPHSWREARVVFIPKAGRNNPTYSKEFRPISLTSFLLKTLEKILDAHIRAAAPPRSLSKAQHAYTKGRSVETALHTLVFNIERALEYKEYALGAFLDISGAFNNVSTESILNSIQSIGVDPAIQRWIRSLLTSRRIRAEWNDAKMTKEVCRGTPQGGVLSPLLWTLVVNKLLRNLEGKAPKIVAYADDIAILITGRCLQTISSIMTTTLNTVQNWASQAGLGLNPEKTDLLVFTRKHKIPLWRFPSINGTQLSLKDRTKYLGVVLDSKLLWKHNVEERVRKASNALYACRQMLGTTWGLSPSLMHWCYTAIVRPILLYGAVVWWTGVRKSTYRKPMERVQRLAALCITGALRTTPTAALELVLNLPPIDLFAENCAAKSAGRLLAAGEFTYRTFGHSSVGNGGWANTDYMIPLFNWERRFKVNIEKDGWRKGMLATRNTLNIYTDGSKMDDGVGAGIYCPELGIRQPFKLPDHCSIFQAEVFAIAKAAELASNAPAGNSRVNIYVDSQAAIKAVTSYRISARSVLGSRAAVESVARSKQLHFYWVPGHKGIEGNEIVDEIAKNGVRLTSENVINIGKPMHCLYDDLDRSMVKKIKTRWNELPGCKTAKVMCKTVDRKYTKFLLALDRRDCRNMMGILTGHCLVATHARRMGLTDREDCRKCLEQGTRETMEHLLCTCPALARLRCKHLGSPRYDTLEEVSIVRPQSLLKFASSAGILKDDYSSWT
uniref:Reverse transcriptase n=1 Tax=Bactrocera tryoni TaxID=59916 RepID=A0A142LX29_BACRY|nr:hypothetical protein [Bactrocera tryoni]